MSYTYQVEAYDPHSTEWNGIKPQHATALPAWDEYQAAQEDMPDAKLRLVQRFGKLGKIAKVLDHCGEVTPRYATGGPEQRVGNRWTKGKRK
jgi:hypothetical protein